jgi:hypothetical protein
VAFTSAVFVVVIDWTRTGASPPTSTQPTRIFRDFLRSTTLSLRRRPSSARCGYWKGFGIGATTSR